jgi:enoyl-CoA hydratase/carnithine racemase
MDLIVTGRLMTGDEAVASGLFSRVFPADELVDATRAAAREASTGPTEAFVASKRLIASLRDERLGLWAAMSAENRAQAALCDTDDYREGFAAFQQKRRPAFTGR